LSITQRLCEKTINQQTHNSGAARAYGCLSTSFSRLERDTRRRGAFSLYWDSNAFALFPSADYLDIINGCLYLSKRFFYNGLIKGLKRMEVQHGRNQ